MKLNTQQEAEIFYNFFFNKCFKLAKYILYAEYLIKCIQNGTLPVGIEFPSAKMIYKNNSLSKAAVNLALKYMEERQYLTIRQGKLCVSRSPDLNPGTIVQTEVRFHGNHHCYHSLNSNKLEMDFERYKTVHQRQISAGEQNSISEELRYVLAVRYNKLHFKPVNVEKIYYTHDFQLLILAMILVIKEKRGAVVVPKNGYVFIVAMLKFAGIKVIEITMEDDGFCVSEFRDIHRNFEIAAFIMFSRASFPYGINTSKEKIKIIYELHKVRPFLVVDLNLVEPWLGSKTNYVLELAGDAMKDVVYVWRPTFLQYESCQVCALTADAAFVEKVRINTKAQGKRAAQSIAFAMSKMLQQPGFRKIEGQIGLSMQKLKEIAMEVFLDAHFWNMAGITADNGDTAFLIPLKGYFPPDTFQQLTAIGIAIVDPMLYTTAGQQIIGIRLEMAHYAEIKTFRKLLIWVNKNCMNLVTGAPLVQI